MSLDEPRRLSPLEEWVDRSLSEVLSEAKSRGEQLLHVRATKLDWDLLPLGVFDSSIADIHFFGGRDRLVLGVGVAKVLEPDPSRHKRGRTKSDLLGQDASSTADVSKVSVMGGWGFPPAHTPRKGGIWGDFGRSRWVVPALTLTSVGGETQLVLAVRVGPSSDEAPMRAHYRTLITEMESATKGQQGRGAGTAAIPVLVRARSIPSRKTWVSLAQEAVDSISRDELKKVVLARALALTFRGEVPTSSVLDRLITLNPDSTVFAIKRKGSVFLGATPESLLSLRRRRVEVGCLAASSPRSKDRAADEILGARLLEDRKSGREHQLVVEAAVGALSPLSSRVEVPSAPVLKKLTTIQHLYTPVTATLRVGENVWTAALALWPNPAIGGEPKEKAVPWIHRFEKLNRGWYSGVVGLLNAGQDEADLVVGIRSGVISGRRAVIYAGAGLVSGSEARDEFEETGWKLKTMSRALGIDADGGG